MSSRIGVAAVLTLQYVRIGTSFETRQPDKFIDGRPNASLAHGVVVDRGRTLTIPA